MTTFSKTDIARLTGEVSDDMVAQLTKVTGGVLDWHNVGGLLRQRAQTGFFSAFNKYSARELTVRGTIIGLAVLGSIAGYKAASRVESANLLLSLLLKASGTFIGLATGGVVAHEIAVRPTINRRKRIIQETKDTAQATINSVRELNDCSSKAPFVAAVEAIIHEIENKELPNCKKGDLVTNLALKRRLMRAIAEHVESVVGTDEDELENALQQSTASLSQGLLEFVKARIEVSEESSQLSPVLA